MPPLRQPRAITLLFTESGGLATELPTTQAVKSIFISRLYIYTHTGTCTHALFHRPDIPGGLFSNKITRWTDIDFLVSIAFSFRKISILWREQQQEVTLRSIFRFPSVSRSICRLCSKTLSMCNKWAFSISLYKAVHGLGDRNWNFHLLISTNQQIIS